VGRTTRGGIVEKSREELRRRRSREEEVVVIVVVKYFIYVLNIFLISRHEYRTIALSDVVVVGATYVVF